MKEQDLKLWKSFVKDVQKLDNKNIVKKETSIKISKSIQNDFSSVLDLHGYTLNNAFQITLDFIEKNYNIGNLKVTIITGRSGQMYQEFVGWLSNPKISRYIRYYQKMEKIPGHKERSYHNIFSGKKQDPGSFQIFLKNKKDF